MENRGAELTAEEAAKKYMRSIGVQRTALWLILLVITGALIARWWGALGPMIWLIYLASLLMMAGIMLVRKKELLSVNAVLTEQCDPFCFTEIWKLLQPDCRQIKENRIISMNLAKGYFYQGDFALSMRVLQTMRVEELQPYMKMHYYNLLSSCEAALGDNSRLRQYHDAIWYCAGRRSSSSRVGRMAAQAQDALAILMAQANGDYAFVEAKAREKLSRSRSAIERVQWSYKLAQCAFAAGDMASARDLCRYVEENGNRLYVVEKAREMQSQIASHTA